MIVFIVIAICYALPLALYSPEPESLAITRKSSLKSRIRYAAATLGMGLGLILVAAVTFDQSHQIDPNIMVVLALSRQGVFEWGFVFQLFTCNFLHINMLHLVGNLSVLLFMSAYERRAGWRRFTAVFIASATIASMGGLLWMPPHTASMGASAGICGLAAAYFLDHGELTLARWIKGVPLVLFIVGLYHFLGPTREGLMGLEIDPGAHLLGAFAGAAFVFLIRARPIPETPGT